MTLPPYEEWKKERLSWWERLAMKLTPTDEFLDYMNMQLQDIRRLLAAAPAAPPAAVDALLEAINSLVVTLGGVPARPLVPAVPRYRFSHIEVPSKAVAGNETEQLWRTEPVGEKGGLAWLKLVSDSSAIKYHIYLDDYEWVIDVAALIDESIERHIPLGAYIEKADGTFVVMVSGGAGMQLTYENSLSITAENTGATEINVTKTELFRRVAR